MDIASSSSLGATLEAIADVAFVEALRLRLSDLEGPVRVATMVFDAKECVGILFEQFRDNERSEEA